MTELLEATCRHRLTAIKSVFTQPILQHLPRALQRKCLNKRLLKDMLLQVRIPIFTYFIQALIKSDVDTANWADFSIVEYPSKVWEETDVEVAITHCG